MLLSCGEYNKLSKSRDYMVKYEAAKEYFAMGSYNRAALFLQETVTVSNEYQDTKTVKLTKWNSKLSNLKKKFRIWHIDIPRNKTNARDRIRNPWCIINLTSDMKDMDKFIVHDLQIQYI